MGCSAVKCVEDDVDGFVRCSESSLSEFDSGTEYQSIYSYSFFGTQAPLDNWQNDIETLGRDGAIREFLEGHESADLCWCAFTKAPHQHMNQTEMFDFYEHCLDFFSTTVSPSIRGKLGKKDAFTLYQEFVVTIFGEAKITLTRREFWYSADCLRSQYDTEQSCTEDSFEAQSVLWHRKQALVEDFFLIATEDTNEFVFKVFQKNPSYDVLHYQELMDMVYHAVVFFSRGHSHEIVLDLSEMADVVAEVMMDIMNGERIKIVSRERFKLAANELRDIFKQLSFETKKPIHVEKESTGV